MPVAHRFDQNFDSEAVSGRVGFVSSRFCSEIIFKSHGHRGTLDNDPLCGPGGDDGAEKEDDIGRSSRLLEHSIHAALPDLAAHEAPADAPDQ